MSNKKKILIGIIYGGMSFEHDISIKSTINIINNIDYKKFKILLIGISKYGSIHINKYKNTKLTEIKLKNLLIKKKNILNLKFNKNLKNNDINLPDIFFSLIHGSFGEDGSLQSILNLIKKPYIGSNIKSSNICINKDLTKYILKEYKFPIIPFIKINKSNLLKISFEKIKNIFGNSFFIKPSNQGSSIGITLVKSKKNFINGISRAFYFSNIVIIEPLIKGKEIECGILKLNNNIHISECAEIIKNNNFYSFYQKYNKNTKILIPANINKNITNKIKQYSKSIFELLECEDIARIDYIISKNNKIYVNEINTIPGFTFNSVYQKLWEFNGIKLKKLISILIKSKLNIKNI